MQVTIFLSDIISQGIWAITNDASSCTAVYSDIGFTYCSPTTQLMYGSNGGKNYVRSQNINGSDSNGLHLILKLKRAIHIILLFRIQKCFVIVLIYL